jgi:hypothetical protein
LGANIGIGFIGPFFHFFPMPSLGHWARPMWPNASAQYFWHWALAQYPIFSNGIGRHWAIFYGPNVPNDWAHWANIGPKSPILGAAQYWENSNIGIGPHWYWA